MTWISISLVYTKHATLHQKFSNLTAEYNDGLDVYDFKETSARFSLFKYIKFLLTK